MAKRVDPLKAKQARQKKIAIGLSVLFVAVLAFQAPKMMALMKGPSAAAQAAAEPPDPAAATPAASPATPAVAGAPAAAAGAAPAAAGEAQPAVLADSDLPVSGGEGQLLSFEQFPAKDPFDQQVDLGAVTGGAEASPTTDPSGAAPGTIPSGLAPGVGAGATTGTGTTPGTGVTGTLAPAPATTPGGTSGGSTAAPAEAAAAATTISLNGELADIAADNTFPAADPLFVLVSVAKDGKSAEIGVAGGAYAGGDKTITLKIGKPLTLQNTADGSRFELELLTVAGFVPPKSKG